jgi:hypothetical protein
MTLFLGNKRTCLWIWIFLNNFFFQILNIKLNKIVWNKLKFSRDFFKNIFFKKSPKKSKSEWVCLVLSHLHPLQLNFFPMIKKRLKLNIFFIFKIFLKIQNSCETSIPILKNYECWYSFQNANKYFFTFFHTFVGTCLNFKTLF